MTCGIYKLSFKGTDKVYIGQSHNIEKRFLEHKKVLLSGLASIKLIEAYQLYGMPTLDILIECDEHELDLEEEAAIEVWDSYINGFNSRNKATGGGLGSYGELNGRAKYSNTQIENVFNMLLTNISISEIVKVSGVSISTIHSIKGGTNHTWLKQKYPAEYASLINDKYKLRGTAAQRGIIYPTLVSKTGEEFSSITNVREFARLHGLDSGGLNKLLNRKAISHRGWTVKT